MYCKNTYLHIMFSITKKFYDIMFSGFSGIALKNCCE